MSNLIHRYFSFNERSINTIANNNLWFATLDSFNDPFEGEVKFENEIADLSKCAELFIELAKQHGPEALGIRLSEGQDIRSALIPYFCSPQRLEELANISFGPILDSAKKFINQMKHKWGFCCFNQDFKKESALENKLMWGHYGDGLRGFALSFDQEKIFDNLDEVEGPYNIDYQDELHRLNVFEIAHEYHNVSMQDATDKFVPIFLTKSEPWRYEQETRFLRYNSGLQVFNEDSLRLVTFGDKMPAVNRNTIEQLLKRYSRVNIQTAKRREDRYEIFI